MKLSHSRSPLAPLVLLALALALAGCGGSTKTVTVSGPPPGVPGAGSGAPATTGTTRTRTAAPPALHLGAFRSPTGNIGCVVVEEQARCDIEHRSWSPPARPAGCPTIVDFGQGLEMQQTGAPHFVCAGDTARDPHSPSLEYGHATRVGAYECASAASGMTCRRPADGHGFFLSIQSYRIF